MLKIYIKYIIFSFLILVSYSPTAYGFIQPTIEDSELGTSSDTDILFNGLFRDGIFGYVSLILVLLISMLFIKALVAIRLKSKNPSGYTFAIGWLSLLNFFIGIIISTYILFQPMYEIAIWNREGFHPLFGSITDAVVEFLCATTVTTIGLFLYTIAVLYQRMSKNHL